jgi:hypothetical protein
MMHKWSKSETISRNGKSMCKVMSKAMMKSRIGNIVSGVSSAYID